MTAPKSKSVSSHVRIYAYWLELPAWKELSSNGVSLLVHIMALYRPNEPNSFNLSVSKIARTIKCSRATASKTISELEELGWVAVESVGSMKGPYSKRTAVYSLTMFMSDYNNPQKSFERYKVERAKIDE